MAFNSQCLVILDICLINKRPFGSHCILEECIAAAHVKPSVSCVCVLVVLPWYVYTCLADFVAQSKVNRLCLQSVGI